MITRIVLVAATVTFVTWLTLSPSIGRTIRTRRTRRRP